MSAGRQFTFCSFLLVQSTAFFSFNAHGSNVAQKAGNTHTPLGFSTSLLTGIQVPHKYELMHLPNTPVR